MPKAYRLKRYDHVTPAKRRRLLEEDLVPIFDDSVDSTLDIKNYLNEGDWLVDYEGFGESFYVYRFKLYRHEPRLHLYVKHFAETDSVFIIHKSSVSDETHLFLSKTEHLELLPDYIFEMLEVHHERAKTNLNEKLKQLITKLKLRRNTLTPLGAQALRDIETGRISKARLIEALTFTDPVMIKNVMDGFPDMTESEKEQGIKNVGLGQWDHRVRLFFNLDDYNKMKNTETVLKVRENEPAEELVDPNKVDGAISRAALDTYIKKHDGRLPTVKEFEKLTKSFRTARRIRK